MHLSSKRLTVKLLHQDDVMLSDTQTLGNCGFTNQTARPQAPATVGLAFRTSGKPSPDCQIWSPTLRLGGHVPFLAPPPPTLPPTCPSQMIHLSS